MSKLITLINWTVYDQGGAATRVLRFTDGEGYNDSTAPGFYYPRAEQPLLFLTAVTPDPFRSGPAVSGGGIVFKNQDFALTDPTSDLGVLWSGQSLMDFGIAGHPVEILLGYDDADYSTFTSIFSGIAEGIAISRESVTLNLRDPLQGFQKPLALYAFAGTNAPPAGTEGNADDVKGQHKPVIGGAVFAVEARQCNTSRNIYQVHDGNKDSTAIVAAYQAGVAKAAGAARTFANIDSVTDPTAGQVDYHLGGTGSPPSGTYIRLDTTTADPITVDVQGPGHTNLILQSQTFDNASWTKTESTVSANAVADSSGLTVADKLAESATAGVEHLIKQTFAVTANTVYCASIELKAAGRDYARVTLADSLLTSGIRLDVDLTAGTGTLSTFGTASHSDYGIADLGSGWYRVAVIGTIDAASTTAAMKVQPASALATVSYNGDVTKGIYLSRAQAELTAPTQYQVTTAAAVSSCKTLPADIARDWIVDRAGGDVDHGDIMLLNNGVALATGFFNRDDLSIAAALDQIFIGALAKWYLEQNVFRCFKFQDPASAGTSVLTFRQFTTDVAAASGDADIIEWSLEPVQGYGGLTPCYRVTVGYLHYWSTQKDGLDASITQTRRAALQNEYRYTSPTEDLTILTAYPDALDLKLETNITNLTNANTLRDSLFSLFSDPRPMLRIVSDLDSSVADMLRLGRPVTVKLAALGYASGRAMIIVGKLYNAQTRRLEVILWG